MKDFNFFTTENGVASLILREVPYQQVAYIRIRDSLEPAKLLEECISFCRMVGAEKILATGHEDLEQFPLETAVWQMSCLRESLGTSNGLLFPVTTETADHFQKLYNKKVKNIPNAAWMDDKDKREMLASGEGYFVHKDGKLLGIGRVKGEEVRFLASFAPGAGETVVRALVSASCEERCTLEVASANTKAVALYERLGFLKTGEISRWYRVFG